MNENFTKIMLFMHRL